MRRISAFILIIIISFAVYVDLSKGTLPKHIAPVAAEVTNLEKDEQEVGLPYFEKEVNRGDTVLSIIEQQNMNIENLPINVIAEDFSTLNNGIKPEEIQYGNTYKFPSYNNEN
ncbi:MULTISPECIES: hypothetical protein [Cytobacillus]|uniref:hypothetical protein n=1 Tax=Cytobacillus TaxID=2675230 RepID=UPI001CD452C3|nr:hypothetical protein [Cytobacillus kochii]MCA1025468.1 hypothetical protein [Cytobacillus kochii]MCM3320571.1 hypothetical protein [Cytobacillus kochii]MCM3344595.1 hypothetical protein [Cytobacillus kochii]MDM5208484.1 hypothetical protein [Cytobacillus kochii]